jgi:hypothetical protein
MGAGACHMLDDERSLWTVVVIGGFGASPGPAEKIIGPRQARRKCDGRIFRRDGRIYHVYPAFRGRDQIARHQYAAVAAAPQGIVSVKLIRGQDRLTFLLKREKFI